MRQKTFKTTECFTIGEQVLLYSKQHEGGKEVFYASVEYAKTGYPGNMNCDICRFHGWRGTSYGTATYAYGVREVKKITPTLEKDYAGNPIYKVTVGQDIASDKE